MIYSMFTIYDRVTNQYGEPFLSVSVETAKRKFNYLMSKSEMVADDCQLYQLAEFNNESGALISFDKPVFVCNYERGA